MSKPYWQKLQDPRWQRKRLEILNRADFKCEKCGDKTTTLQVHHGYYEKGAEPWEYENETLWCLCSSCHLGTQATMRDAQRELAMFKPEDFDWLAPWLRSERTRTRKTLGDVQNAMVAGLGTDHDAFVEWFEVALGHDADELKSVIFKLHTKAIEQEPRWKELQK